jgi:diguanylate cyclase (GGDEF)-like protein/PAS domain S-box-containing protein
MNVTNLSAFIQANIEPIIDRWEQFAKDIPSAKRMDEAALRDHIKGILGAIAADLDNTQTPHEQSEKSKGRGKPKTSESDAGLHGAARLAAGFSVNDEISEFRALRASVLRLWSDSNTTALSPASDDLIRFNEAVDQALTESVERYSAEKDQYTRLFDTLLSFSPDLNYLISLDGRFIYANKALTSLFGMPLSDVVGKNFVDLGISLAPDFQQNLCDLTKTKATYRMEMPFMLASGKEVNYEFFFVPVTNNNGETEAIAGTARDITELTWLSSNRDVLTGLPNRNRFRYHLAQAVRQARLADLPLALMIVDLDDFKQVNDTLGHRRGDILLKETAQRLHSCLGDSDILASLGGDEFAVILTDLHDPGNIDLVAGHILKTLSEPFRLASKVAYVTASIGITLYPEDATDTEELIKNADQAMYAAKLAGRNRFHYFTPAMQEAAQARLRLIDDLRGALEGNQFEVAYQPIVELATGAIRKAEALIRWRHPTRGLISPADFIPTAEEIGMIASFGNWIFHEAAMQAAQWRNEYDPSFQISVNISPLQFRNEGIDSSVWFDCLKNLDLPGQGIVVEITEGLLLDASTKVTDQLLMLRDAGIGVSLDDFGTGYSSLSYLKKFDIDYLKIDQSFVHNLTKESDDLALCEAIIAMAHKLGIKVIAEGIETVEQRDLLANAGCDFGQGYLFSAPVPSLAFGKLL